MILDPNTASFLHAEKFPMRHKHPRATYFIAVSKPTRRPIKGKQRSAAKALEGPPEAPVLLCRDTWEQAGACGGWRGTRRVYAVHQRTNLARGPQSLARTHRELGRGFWVGTDARCADQAGVQPIWPPSRTGSGVCNCKTLHDSDNQGRDCVACPANKRNTEGGAPDRQKGPASVPSFCAGHT